MRNRAWLVALAVVVTFGVMTPAVALADSASPTPTPSVSCSVGTDAAGNVVVTCGPGESWPTDLQVGICFDKQLQADGQTVVVTCTPPGVEPPPLPVPPTPTPSVPCSVGSDVAGNVVITCAPGQSWPSDVQVGSCFDKQLQADGQTVVVTCTPPGVEPPPLPVPPTPAPVVPCSVGTDAAGNVVITCGPGESWPGNVQIGTCFDKQLQADGQTVVVTCSPGTPSVAAKRLPMLAGVSIAKSVGALGARKAGVATK